MSKFYVWIDNPTSTSCMTSDAFNSDSQRQIGFQSGKPASAIRINTAIRQANLIAVALVNALNITDDKSVMTSLKDMTNWFKGLNLFKLDSLFTVGIGNVQTTLNKSIQPITDNSLSLGLNEYRFANIFVNKFNGNNVEDIFETNGTTVKNATNAEKAFDTERINNITIDSTGTNETLYATVRGFDTTTISQRMLLWEEPDGTTIDTIGMVFTFRKDIRYSRIEVLYSLPETGCKLEKGYFTQTGSNFICGYNSYYEDSTGGIFSPNKVEEGLKLVLTDINEITVSTLSGTATIYAIYLEK